MPFIYRKQEIAKIDRSRKRDDDFIHTNIIKSLEFISNFTKSSYIKIMPVSFEDPPFDKADPRRFLILYATKILGLNLYEVEYWLDYLADEHVIPLNKVSRAYIDERRKYYREPKKTGSFGNPKTMGGFISSYIIYRSSTKTKDKVEVTTQ